MKKETVQDKLKNLQNKKVELEQKITSLQNQLTAELENVEWIEIPETDLEVTKNVIYKNKSYNEIIKLKKPEEELLTLKLIGTICEYPELLKILKMDGSSTSDDFFFKQPFPQNEANNYVARFYSDSDYSVINCGVNPSDSNSDLGVRFTRKKNLGAKK